MTVKNSVLDSPMGKCTPDHAGPVVGVVRMNVDASYKGIGDLLQDYINKSNHEAWQAIKSKIDYTYKYLALALGALETETGFSNEVRTRIAKGQKLLFKPNLVNPINISAHTHAPGNGSSACTEWPFVAALMRWFREVLGISYYSMALGEAATTMTAAAHHFSKINPDGARITPEAVIEGKCGSFYGGWGFYFVRKYLSESQVPSATDDPMTGYEDSIAGNYIPTGLVTDRLMVYDLNRIFDDPTKGRVIDVPDGVNYQSITLHKAIVGGDKNNQNDLSANPGCIIVNVPKLKVHAFTLLTNVIKNLGIGLYPMQSSMSGGYQWDYSIPHNQVTGAKGGIPHQIWIPEIDRETGFPKRDAQGNYIVRKTGGITATMIDIIKAVINQDIFMIHVVDGIEAINVDHQSTDLGIKEPEGMVFAGLDPVALDLLSARYLFSNVPLKDALKVRLIDDVGGYFPQAVPIPIIKNNSIVSELGYDCPLSRDMSLAKAEERGLGKRQYHAIGHDASSDAPIISLQGHLGSMKNGVFSDLITTTIFYDTLKFPWDMQKTALSYLKVTDELAGTSHYQEFMQAFDEDGDGIITYEDFGKKGTCTIQLHFLGDMISRMGSEKFGLLKGLFSLYAKLLKCTDHKMNAEGLDALREVSYGMICGAAFKISRLELEFPDPFKPGLICGKGKWPSFQLAQFLRLGMTLYGLGYPYTVAFPSLYSSALLYADLNLNGGQYAGPNWTEPRADMLNKYLDDVNGGNMKPLDFTLYVPAGYDNLSGKNVPNIEVTDNPAKILTAVFAGGKEVWP